MPEQDAILPPIPITSFVEGMARLEENPRSLLPVEPLVPRWRKVGERGYQINISVSETRPCPVQVAELDDDEMNGS